MKKTTFGMQIASLRKANELTQAQLAEKMGVTDKAVSKWERDLSCPDVSSLPRLAEIFGISVDELMRVRATNQPANGESVGKLVALICRAVALAMGIAVAVLSTMKKIDPYSGLAMVGIGLACVGVSLLQDHNKNNE